MYTKLYPRGDFFRKRRERQSLNRSGRIAEDPEFLPVVLESRQFFRFVYEAWDISTEVEFELIPRAKLEMYRNLFSLVFGHTILYRLVDPRILSRPLPVWKLSFEFTHLIFWHSDDGVPKGNQTRGGSTRSSIL